MYACDLLEGTKEKDWTEIDPFKIAKPPKWCSKIWFLLHIRQVLIIVYIYAIFITDIQFRDIMNM